MALEIPRSESHLGLAVREQRLAGLAWLVVDARRRATGSRIALLDMRLKAVEAAHADTLASCEVVFP